MVWAMGTTSGSDTTKMPSQIYPAAGDHSLQVWALGVIAIDRARHLGRHGPKSRIR